MAQKILSARSSDAAPARGDMVAAAVDQIVFARGPRRAYAEAVAAGLKKTSVEVAIAYDGCCVTADAAADESARVSSTEASVGPTSLWLRRNVGNRQLPQVVAAWISTVQCSRSVSSRPPNCSTPGST